MVEFLSNVLQGLVDGASNVLDFIFNLFPKSPFSWVSNTAFGDLLEKINYFVPVADFVTMLEAWLVAIGIYYLYSIWARWVKGIE